MDRDLKVSILEIDAVNHRPLDKEHPDGLWNHHLESWDFQEEIQSMVICH